jgi:hypothetical protein
MLFLSAESLTKILYMMLELLNNSLEVEEQRVVFLATFVLITCVRLYGES